MYIIKKTNKMGVGDIIFNIPPDREIVVEFRFKKNILTTLKQSVFIPFDGTVTDSVKELAYNMSNLKDPIENYRVTYYEKTQP